MIFFRQCKSYFRIILRVNYQNRVYIDQKRVLVDQNFFCQIVLIRHCFFFPLKGIILIHFNRYIRSMRIAMVVSNDLANDQRVLKMCYTLQNWGHQVQLTGRQRRTSPPLPDFPFKTTRLKLLFETGPLFYMMLQLRLFFHLLFTKQDLIHANDLDTLLPSWLVAKIKGCKLVYDTHEYFTGVPELSHRPMVRKIWKTLESAIFPGLNKVITVNHSIAGLYKTDYGMLPMVVRNVPSVSNALPAVGRKELGLPEDKFILIMQGSGINVDRGAEEAVEMMKYLDKTLLIIAGSGDVIPSLKQYVSSSRLGEKVKFIAKMPYSELMKYTAVSDIGLSLDKDSNINYRFSLPNKLFDYIRAGIPVMASDLPEVRKVLEETRSGLITADHDPVRMAAMVTSLRSDYQHFDDLKKQAVKAAGRYSWETEVKAIKSWYE